MQVLCFAHCYFPCIWNYAGQKKCTCILQWMNVRPQRKNKWKACMVWSEGNAQDFSNSPEISVAAPLPRLHTVEQKVRHWHCGFKLWYQIFVMQQEALNPCQSKTKQIFNTIFTAVLASLPYKHSRYHIHTQLQNMRNSSFYRLVFP